MKKFVILFLTLSLLSIFQAGNGEEKEIKKVNCAIRFDGNNPQNYFGDNFSFTKDEMLEHDTNCPVRVSFDLVYLSPGDTPFPLFTGLEILATYIEYRSWEKGKSYDENDFKSGPRCVYSFYQSDVNYNGKNPDDFKDTDLSGLTYCRPVTQ
jgi:hypothetical protein